MMLLTKELREQLPPLYASEQIDDPMVVCKFFYPDFHWRWYAIEFDGKDTFFGYVGLFRHRSLCEHVRGVFAGAAAEAEVHQPFDDAGRGARGGGR